MSPMTLDESGGSGDGHRELTAAEIGETVRKYRIKRGMRQGDLAEKAGLSTSFISQFERGITDASISSLTRMCFALGITVGSLFNTETSGVQVLPVENTKAIELERAIKRVYSRPSFKGRTCTPSTCSRAPRRGSPRTRTNSSTSSSCACPGSSRLRSTGTSTSSARATRSTSRPNGRTD